MAAIVKLSAIAFRGARRVRSADDGVTAIEFGLLALPFFSVLGAIFEVGLFLFAGQLFDSAVAGQSRTIMVGKRVTETSFRTGICEGTVGIIDCSEVKLRVRPISSFSSANADNPVDGSGDWNVTEEFSVGGSGQVMLVEAYYKWKTFLSFSYGFAKYGDSVVLSSVRVFMNEPY